MPVVLPLAMLRLIVAALFPLNVNAYGRGFGGYGDAFNERVGPYDANSTEFLTAIAASNATGLFHIPGYDVSQPYPGKPITGWTLRLAAVDLSQATALSPPSPIPSNNDEDSGDDAMIGYSLTIQAPPRLLHPTPPSNTTTVTTDPSWGMCLWNFGSPNHLTPSLFNNPSRKPLSRSGSCAGFLSPSCIAALQRAPQTAYKTSPSPGRFGSRVTCAGIAAPPECGAYGPGNAKTSVASYEGVPVPFLNGSVTTMGGWLFERDRGVYYNSTGDLRAFWDSMVVNYWVVVTAMVDVEGKEEGGLVGVHCVAPDGIGTGRGFAFRERER
ncbi:hypothetical protein C8A05DRAFT_35027 [Staphylotrichum tortipilum]|uniref:Uncharacterized protein n=1 Tax=Staphylotrichum tortipilum TaxID=2831512 RepID=A0AAN6RS17_9PEZI|nr:hypothetical protein C8A05DRAFT_35027 [Staphylotrichum longicolle]